MSRGNFAFRWQTRRLKERGKPLSFSVMQRLSLPGERLHYYATAIALDLFSQLTGRRSMTVIAQL